MFAPVLPVALALTDLLSNYADELCASLVMSHKHH